ncbi:MAG: hypothetical protein J5I52_07290 [Saprospiraceae bacterium]|nr:hypothetical protein [Saprospiraceae bacterium]
MELLVEIDKVIKQSSGFTDGYQKALVNLLYTANHFRDTHQKVFKKYGIQGQHFNVMRILKGKHPEAVTPGYIKEVMIDKGRDLTRLVDKLETLGWVTRRVCEDNKRQMNINLTEIGIKKLDELRQIIKKLDDQLKCMTEEEYNQLSALLDKMRG